MMKSRDGGGGRRRRRDQEPQEREFEQRVIDLARVTRVVAGGKRMRFRALVAVGDLKGRVGVAMGKGADVASAVSKATTKAKKNLITVPLSEGTIPHEIRQKSGAAYIMLKPAPPGTGVIAGGPVRILMEMAGIKNIVSKILGTRNKINNVHAVMAALTNLTPRPGNPKVVAPTAAVVEEPKA